MMKIDAETPLVGVWWTVYFPRCAAPCQWLSWLGDDEYTLSTVPRLTRNNDWAIRHYADAVKSGAVLADWDVEFRKVYAPR
jgi:hypothetical protein